VAWAPGGCQMLRMWDLCPVENYLKVGDFLQCPAFGCTYKREMPQIAEAVSAAGGPARRAI